MKIAITQKALEQRIKRRLAKSGQQLRRSRPVDVDRQGTYYVVDISLNAVVDSRIEDIEDFGRKLEVLAGWETLRES